ncbi:MAG: alanine--glyoxylate aminotransferase family protein [Anaerolineae bacterium]|nr:alanine--glyoxylate aminotransferase family protein [Thermoflexales bacterium]MDW8396334.1 alanine--glyoxylate aminotransferase family protein [Anaerolineae bacterium]
MSEHIKLFIPGPVEVRRDILEAQTQWMIGHRGKAFESLFARIQTKLRTVFYTQQRVYLSTSSGTGLWEAAARNCVSDDPDAGVLATVCGAFSERWADVFERNGKATTRLTVPEGEPITPELVEAALRARQADPTKKPFEAIAIVHNETSCGLTNPLAEIVAVVKALSPETLILVDAVSSLGGVKIEFDALGLDVLLTSSQKCLGLPPGLAFAAVSDRALAKAHTVRNRGYYFDFVEMEAFLRKNHTPATPAISLMFALDRQLDDILAEGLEQRFARHRCLAERTRAWAKQRFALFPREPYASDTVTCVKNTRGIDISALNAFLAQRNMHLSDGYGALKGKTFRIAHMADTTEADIAALLAAIDEFLGE